ncbi:hypothetical protein RBH26_20410 [Natronolimnohabitans sp. A-GB9]|uniref:hypothetical protein n=1 Tax=Natronolimnohabitans sp. A-GB9 TaxID=3069757 RepID=UPI0027B6F9DD|nr:hypothetical protein [Natronolimnohabitans sp. A-GB9]MDQ2052807.1 hypothetical protein [Natronolimnohabitans sp. A-GB9]
MRAISISAVTILLLVSVGTILAGGVAAGEDADMEVTDTIETPSETITIEGSEYEVDEIAVIEQGGTIEVQVTSSEDYYLQLYDTDAKSEVREFMSDEVSVVVLGDDDDDLEPGTYMLSLEPDLDRVAVTPVVVQGYDIELEYPSSAETGSEVELEATVEPTTGLEQPDSVEVGIWDGSDTTNATLTHNGGTDYSTTHSLDELDTGSYDVYATVLADETVEGYPVTLAVEEGDELQVTDSEDDENGGAPVGGGSPGDSDDDTSDESDVNEDEKSDSDSDSESESESDADEDSSGQDDETGSDDGTDEASDDGTDETNDDDDEQNVIDPNETNGADDTDDDESSADDGLGTSSLLVGVIALALALAVIVRRSS